MNDPLCVFETVPGPTTTIRFVDQIVRDAPADIRFAFWSWRNALIGRYDVVHFHWPEMLVRSTRPLLQVRARLLFTLFLILLTLRRVPVIRTLHNAEPFTRGDRGERLLLGWLNRLTQRWVHLNGCGPMPHHGEVIRIPHGDYHEEFAAFERYPSEPGRYTLVGRLRPYKNVDGLIRSFATIANDGERLHIVGDPKPGYDVVLLEEADRARAVGKQVALTFGFVSDAEMVEEVTRSEIVVLPYNIMYNSGVAFVALSLGRPVIAPRNCANEELQREVGAEWITLFDGPFSADVFRTAIAQLRSARSREPSFAGRDWPAVAEAHAEVFRSAAHRRPLVSAQ